MGNFLSKSLSVLTGRYQAAVVSQQPEKPKEDLVEEFKAAYKIAGPLDYKSQIPYLSQLADYYSTREDWASLVRAHSLYVSCAKREDNSEWAAKAFGVAQAYWSRNHDRMTPTAAHLHEVKTLLKNRLAEIREKYKERLQNSERFISELPVDVQTLKMSDKVKLYQPLLEEVPQVSRQLRDDMISFTSLIIDKAVSICGEPPCEFSVVGLGSLARGETTPYSDLEFMFLVERKTDQIEKYFVVLAVTVYFLIGDLDETKLKYMAIHELMDWDEGKQKYTGHWFNDTTVNGFKIDGLGIWAGNIPTGSDSDKQKNKYICTVEEICGRYQQVLDSPDPVESLTGDLTAMLASTVHIYGCESLHKCMQESLSFKKPNEDRDQANRKLLERDVNRFDFKLGIDLMHKRDIKADIYRYPSLLILDLKIVHGIQASDPWQVITELEVRDVISATAADYLRFLLCCAVYSRLATYFHYGSQNDQVSVLSAGFDHDAGPGIWQVPRPLLVHMFLHLIPLKEVVKRPVSDAAALMRESESEEFRVHAAAAVHYWCGDYRSALSALRTLYNEESIKATGREMQFMYIYSTLEEEEYGTAEQLLTCRLLSQQADALDYSLMGRLCQVQSRYRDALRYYQQGLDMYFSVQGDKDYIGIAASYSNIGLAYDSLGDHTQALEYYQKALDTQLELFGDKGHSSVAISYEHIGAVHASLDEYGLVLEYHRKGLDTHLRLFGDQAHTNVATSCNNIGLVYKRLGDYWQALEYLQKASDVWMKLANGKDHTSVATSYANIGSVYEALGDYNQALQCYHKTLDMQLRLFGDQVNAAVATSYGLIGAVYIDLGDYNQALKYSHKALDMELRLFGDKPHSVIITSYNNVGIISDALGEYSQALAYYQKALAMELKLFGDKDHTSVATSYSNIAAVYASLGDFTQALEYFQKALGIKLRLFGDKAHPSVATTYSNIATVLATLDHHSQALEYHQKALGVTLKCFGGKDHLTVAVTHSGIGVVHYSLGDYRHALQNFQKAVDMQLRLFHDKAHVDIATSYNNIGLVYDALGNYSQALQHHQKALDMNMRLLGDRDHSSIATAYSNIGAAHASLGDTNQALENLQKALHMQLRLFGDKPHPSVATSYGNVGLMYDRLGEYTKALEYHRKALAMELRLFGDQEHTSVATSYSNIGSLYDSLGDYSQALEYYQKALDMLRVIYPSDSHPRIETVLYNIKHTHSQLDTS